MPKLTWGNRLAISVILLIALIQPLIMEQTWAVSSSAPTSGITVSPAFITAQVGSAQRQAIASVGVRNNYSVPITVTAVLNGFDIKNNSLLPTNRSESVLSDVIKFSPAEITIPPQSSRNIAVTVNDKPSLAPGGHYVSLLITQSSSTGPNALPQLSLKPAVSATIYVIKEDGAIRSLLVTELKPQRNIFSLPDSVDVVFTNDGNVVSIPRGVLTVRQGESETIFAQAIVNQDSVPLYPKQSTTLRVSLLALSKPKMPGKLTTNLEYRPDGQNTTKSVSVSAWYVPKASLVGFLVISVFVGGLVWPKSRLRILRLVRLRNKTKRKAFIAPDPKAMLRPERPSPKSASQNKRHFDIK